MILCAALVVCATPEPTPVATPVPPDVSRRLPPATCDAAATAVLAALADSPQQMFIVLEPGSSPVEAPTARPHGPAPRPGPVPAQVAARVRVGRQIGAERSGGAVLVGPRTRSVSGAHGSMPQRPGTRCSMRFCRPEGTPGGGRRSVRVAGAGRGYLAPAWTGGRRGPDMSGCRPPCFHGSMGSTDRDRALDREVRRRLRRLRRSIGDDLGRLIQDAGATKARVATAASVDRTHIGRIETGVATPSLETLVALGAALGADVSIRFYAGTGPRLTDRHQARMVEAVLGGLAPVWRAHLEVAVWRPVRGVIDGVFERSDDARVVIAEFMSTMPRLEQQLRWSAEKAASIGSAELFRDRVVPSSSTLLVLRSTAATRAIVRRFEATMRVAYPARSCDAVRSLTVGDPWPGPALIWIRIDRDIAELLDRPPRGISVGR